MDKLQDKYLPKQRLETLTDGVYTVALTLLVTSLGLLDGFLTEAQFNMSLIDQVPKITAWLISAILIIFNWMTFVRTTNF